MTHGLGRLPESLQEAVAYFSDVEKTHKWAVALRWPNGTECPRCAHKEHSYISTRHLWFCKGCKKQFTVKVGSIFEDSPLGMDKWMLAVWLIVTCGNGIGSYEIASHLAITQKSARHMMHRVRKGVQSVSFAKLSGRVEVDETFIGAKARNMHANVIARRTTGTGGKDKTAVMGIPDAKPMARPARLGLLSLQTGRRRPFNPRSASRSKRDRRCMATRSNPTTDLRASMLIG